MLDYFVWSLIGGWFKGIGFVSWYFLKFRERRKKYYRILIKRKIFDKVSNFTLDKREHWTAYFLNRKKALRNSAWT
jgi:hypothetical protein